LLVKVLLHTAHECEAL